MLMCMFGENEVRDMEIDNTIGAYLRIYIKEEVVMILRGVISYVLTLIDPSLY